MILNINDNKNHYHSSQHMSIPHFGLRPVGAGGGTVMGWL